MKKRRYIKYQLETSYILILFIFFFGSISFAQNTNRANSDSTQTIKTSTRIKAAAGSIIPGIILHGTGHKILGEKEAGKKLSKIERISFITGASSLVALSFLGNADETSGVLIPMTMLSFGTFMVTWLSDIAGTTGLSNHLSTGQHSYKQSFVNLSYHKQDNNQSPYYNFYGSRIQYGNDKFFAQLYAEIEESSDYQEFAFKGGYNIRQREFSNLYLIPEAKYRYSTEGFDISQLDLQLEMDINLGKISHTLNNIYFVSTLGYGRSKFDFGRNNKPYSDNLLIVSQGIRFQINKLVDFSTKYIRREDGFIAGRSWMLTHFEHGLRVNLKDFFTEFKFTHGQGFRTSINLGYQL